ncbi:50S ribosomal protein L9 [Notoacmeibacter ruber]|uniref:Large ribosomal subunit protein bL9 n=1 Tax=Notoacmeibacter ruber TaxID=2670375 RepID=A0A3L7JA47_9HYPH|nr:50S ribosomal protein L9 [Notoacmeibacter ruber]RLQ87628.1 50S ribosomal protein L9 [Notoacmeibacter ruber]
MQVILLERVNKLGGIGDTVTVKPGFARNYLIPTGRALRANETNKARFEAERAQIEARNEERKSEARKIADELDGKTFVVIRSAAETGQLYGSVSSRDISDLLKSEGFKVGRSQVDLNQAIKAIGITDVPVELHPEVRVSISLNIARTTDEAERQVRGEDLTSAEAIYGEDINDAAQPEEFFEEDDLYDDGSAPAEETDSEEEEQSES